MVPAILVVENRQINISGGRIKEDAFTRFGDAHVTHTDAVSREQCKRPSGRAENSPEAVLIDDSHRNTTQ